MKIPILQTRLKPPSLPDNLIIRPELFEKLSAGEKNKLILISAPAGYGKTTLAGQWLQRQERTVLWLSIDSIHSDSRIFMQYLLSAFGAEYDLFNKQLWQIPQLRAEWDSMYLLGHLINELNELRSKFILVLDDYHLIDNDENNDIVGFLLNNLPSGISILMTSRRDPHLPLARMRAKQELVEINLLDLQFQGEDTEDLIRGNALYPLTAEEILKIHIENEGWITGIRLAILAYNRKSSDHMDFAKDYLFEEILEKEDDRLVSFLFNTSILTYLNASLCDALYPEGVQPSDEILTELLQKNIFIKKVETEGDWYRLHPLFLEILIEKRNCNVRDLHIRAAMWFWDRGQYDECFNHLLNSGNYSLTVSYLEKSWPLMEQEFIFLPWLKWAQAIPESEKTRHPLFLCQFAWAQLNLGQLKQCEISLKVVERLISPFSGDNSLLLQISSAWSYLSFIRRNLDKTVEYAERMEQLVDPKDSFFLIQSKLYKALAHWLMGKLDQAYGSFEKFRDEMLVLRVPSYALGSYLALIQIRVQQGSLGEALKLFEEAIQIDDIPDRSLDKLKASLYLRSAAIHFESGDPESMEAHLAKSAELSLENSLVDYPYQWHQFRALVFESENKWDKAIEEILYAEHLFVQTLTVDNISIEEQKIRIWIRMGKMTIAKKALHNLINRGDTNPSFQNESLLLIKIRFSLAYNYSEPKELLTALDQLNRLAYLARLEDRFRSLIEILILTTSLLYRLNKKNEACDIFPELLPLAEKCACVQIFYLEKDILEPVFKEFSSRLKAIDAYRTIEKYIDDRRSKNQILSSREQEVLQLMSEGLSNKTIGEKLFVAESTVKGHNQRIFQRLNVSNRTEAMVKARMMGFID